MDKKVIIGLIAVIVVGVAVYYFKTKKSEVPTLSDTKVDETVAPVKFDAEANRRNAIDRIEGYKRMIPTNVSPRNNEVINKLIEENENYQPQSVY